MDIQKPDTLFCATQPLDWRGAPHHAFSVLLGLDMRTGGVLENVRFCGNQKDVRKYLVASDIYVMTSKFEGIPITTIEAMASGVPAILYDVPGLRDFNAERECAELIPEDYGLLAKEIIALSQDKRLQSELTANAQALVNEKYNMRTNAQKIYELYRK